MKRITLNSLTLTGCAVAFTALSTGTATHLFAQSSMLDHGNSALHCQHFPADCVPKEEQNADAHAESSLQSTDGAGSALPLEPGQGMFGAISEINQIIEDSDADWSKVDLDALWEHLQDMDALMTSARVEKTERPDGLRMLISGEGAAERAVRVMIPAHSQFLRSVRPNWDISIKGQDATYEVVVTSTDPSEAAKIRALGFSGFMVQDDHHASHHLGIALGTQVH